MNQKKRKMLLVLPLIVVPFITMAFWALGGGKGKEKKDTSKGLNLLLPDANLKEDKAGDKMSFYEQAEKDSLEREEWIRNDPYFSMDDTVPALENFINSTEYGQRLNSNLYERSVSDPSDHLLKKLKLLQEELNKPASVPEEEEQEQPYDPLPPEDPDIRQLNGALEKILDIQHPDRVKERSAKSKGISLAIHSSKAPDTLVKGFYSYSDPGELEEPNAIEAAIATNQTIVNGGVVKFRTLSDIYINGKMVPKNNLLSGIAAFEGERLTVEISSIRTGKNLYNVKLEVYDMDGLPGIYIPGTINRDVAKETLNNSLSLADIGTLDPSLKAQATATGIGAIKSLISKKAKLVRVQLKAGYKVLLKNKDQ